MKKICIISGIVFFASFLLTSCGNKAENIKVSELEDACDHVDATISCTEAVLDIINDKDDIYDLSRDEFDKLEYLGRKIDLIDQHASKAKISQGDMKDCENYKKLEEFQKQIEDIGKEE